jgi:hypothetical protein
MTGFLRKYGRKDGTVSAINGRASKMPAKMMKRIKSTDIWTPSVFIATMTNAIFLNGQ